MSALDIGFANGASYTTTSLKSAKSRKQTPWTLACSAFCVGQMLGGLVVCALSALHLFDSTLNMGLLVGALLFLVGAVGLAGTMLAHRDLLNFHLVGAILGIVLSFQFVGLLWRQVDVDCALAELFVKTNVLEDLSREFAHESVFNSVYKRMNEMEDMLDSMHYGLGKTVDILRNKPTEGSMDSEKHFLMSKLEVIKTHANKIMQDIVDHPEITNESIQKWPESQRKMVEEKFKTAENLLYQIQQHEKDHEHNTIRPEQYEKMLQSITEAVQIPSIPGKQWEHDMTEIHQLHQDLPYTKDVIKQLTRSIDELDKLSVDHSNDGAVKRAKFDEYKKEYLNLLEEARKGKEHDHHADMLEMMPQHCVEESKAVSYMGFVGVVVALFQMTTIYSTLCVSFRLPIKTD
eukprot:g2058.t1